MNLLSAQQSTSLMRWFQMSRSDEERRKWKLIQFTILCIGSGIPSRTATRIFLTFARMESFVFFGFQEAACLIFWTPLPKARGVSCNADKSSCEMSAVPGRIKELSTQAAVYEAKVAQAAPNPP